MQLDARFEVGVKYELIRNEGVDKTVEVEQVRYHLQHLRYLRDRRAISYVEYTCLSLFQDESVDRFRLQLEDLIFELLVVDDTVDEACPELVLELAE